MSPPASDERVIGPFLMGLGTLGGGVSLFLALRGSEIATPFFIAGLLSSALAAALGMFLTGRRALILGLVLGALVRGLLFLGVDPLALSDDVARYAFEGEMLLEGISPWHHPVDSPVFDQASRARGLTALRARVNHPEIATIYPPLAEAFFSGAATAARLTGLPALSVWRFAALLADLGVFLLLASLLRQRGLSTTLALGWWLNPLVWTEVTVSAHVDVAGALLTLLAVAGVAGNRRALGVLALGAAVATKFVALILGPLIALRAGFRATLLGGLPWLVVALAFLPLSEKMARPATSAEGPSSPRPELQTISSWDALLGKFRIVAPGDTRDGMLLDFDGQGRIGRLAAPGTSALPDFPQYYEFDGDGELVVVDADGEKYGVELGPRRQRLRLAGPRGPLLAVKTPESPFMGLVQYSARWTAHAPLARTLTAVTDEPPREGREIVRRRIAWFLLIAGLFVAAWGAVRPPQFCSALAGSLLALFWFCAPALYPWYLIWVLPFAVLDRRPGLWVWATAATGLHLVTPTTVGTPSPAEIGLYALAALAALGGLFGRKWIARR